LTRKSKTSLRWRGCRRAFVATPVLLAADLAYQNRQSGTASAGRIAFFVVAWAMVNRLVKVLEQRRAVAQPAEVLTVTTAAVMSDELRNQDWSRAAMAGVHGHTGIGAFGGRLGGTLFVGRQSLNWVPSPLSTGLGMPAFEIPLSAVVAVEILPFRFPSPSDYAGVEILAGDGRHMAFLVRGRRRLRDALLRSELFDPDRHVEPTRPVTWGNGEVLETAA
jgi:hypothetical protein